MEGESLENTMQSFLKRGMRTRGRQGIKWQEKEFSRKRDEERIDGEV